jgi:hypothetical protein
LSLSEQLPHNLVEGLPDCQIYPCKSAPDTDVVEIRVLSFYSYNIYTEDILWPTFLFKLIFIQTLSINSYAISEMINERLSRLIKDYLLTYIPVEGIRLHLQNLYVLRIFYKKMLEFTRDGFQT